MPAVIHEPGAGEVHDAGPARIVIKATADDTQGAFFLSENTIDPGFAGPPPHTHERLYDMFYVLDGELTLLVEGETRTAPPGTFACVPPGVVHTFRNTSDAPVRFLNLSTPGGWERYMRDLAAAAAAGPLTPQRIGEVAAAHDFHPA